MPFVQVHDLSIHYEMAGKGEPLILLHGMSNNAQSWRRQLQNLKESFTVIAWDAPGYGQSSDPSHEFREFSQFADVLKRFIEQLRYETVYILGHSMGAAIAIDFTYRYPSIVKSLILSDATRGAAALNEEENEKKLRQRLHSIESLNPKEIAKNRVNALLAPNPNEEVKKEAEKIMGQVRPAGYRAVAYALSCVNQMNMLNAISVPTLIIYGELDSVTPVSEGKIFHEKIKNSNLVTIPGTGHLCYQEDPNSFNQHVAAFLNKSEPESKNSF